MSIGISTISSPYASDLSVNAPTFALTIENASIPVGVTRLIQSIQYDSADGMADMMKIIFRDPTPMHPNGLKSAGGLNGIGNIGSSNGKEMTLKNTKIIQPGNQISLFGGYGPNLKHIGRAIVRRVKPNYPRDDIPSIEVVAYTKDSVMMDSAPEKSKRTRERKHKDGRVYKNTTYAEAIMDRASDYDFELDVDPTFDKPHNFIQKVGLSDYDFVKGISNITGFYFWVDGDSNGKWTIHFKDPNKLSKNIIQDKVYTFSYNQTEYSTLLEFEPELVVHNAITKIEVKVKDPKTGKILESKIEENNDLAPEVLVNVSGDTLRAVDQALNGNYTTASDVKIFLEDYSFEVKTSRRFESEEELAIWTRQWYRRHRENFVMASGTIIGIENVMARQIHNLTGLGCGLDGEYFFSTVTHKFGVEGYTLDCNMRKIVPVLE